MFQQLALLYACSLIICQRKEETGKVSVRVNGRSMRIVGLTSVSYVIHWSVSVHSVKLLVQPSGTLHRLFKLYHEGQYAEVMWVLLD